MESNPCIAELIGQIEKIYNSGDPLEKQVDGLAGLVSTVAVSSLRCIPVLDGADDCIKPADQRVWGIGTEITADQIRVLKEILSEGRDKFDAFYELLSSRLNVWKSFQIDWDEIPESDRWMKSLYTLVDSCLDARSSAVTEVLLTYYHDGYQNILPLPLHGFYNVPFWDSLETHYLFQIAFKSAVFSRTPVDIGENPGISIDILVDDVLKDVNFQPFEQGVCWSGIRSFWPAYAQSYIDGDRRPPFPLHCYWPYWIFLNSEHVRRVIKGFFE